MDEIGKRLDNNKEMHILEIKKEIEMKNEKNER